MKGPALEPTGATPSDITGFDTEASTPKTPSTLALTPSLLNPNNHHRNPIDSGIQTDEGPELIDAEVRLRLWNILNPTVILISLL